MATNIFELLGIISIQNSDANKHIQDTLSKARGLSGTIKGGALTGKVTIDNKTANNNINKTSGKIGTLSDDLKGSKLEGDIDIDNQSANSNLADTTKKIGTFSGELTGGKLDGDIEIENEDANANIADTTKKVSAFAVTANSSRLKGKIGVDNASANSNIADTSGKIETFSEVLANDLDGEIVIENEAANGNIEETGGKVDIFHGKFQEGITKAAEWAKKIAVAAAAATTAVVAGITKIVSNTAGNADQIDKLSKNMSFSTQAFQEWEYVMQLSGVDTDRFKDSAIELQQTMKDVNAGSEDAIKAFHKLGVSVFDTDGKFRSTEAVYQDVIKALNGIENAEERAAVATEIFKGAGEEMAPVFGASAEEIEAMKQQARDLGFILTDEEIAAGVAYTDTVTAMQKSLKSIQNALGLTLLEPMQSFAEYVIDKTPTIKEKIAEWEEPIKNTAVALEEGLEFLLENPEEIKEALVVIGAGFAAWMTASHPYVTAITAVTGAIGALVLAGADGKTQTDKFTSSLEKINDTLNETVQSAEEEAIEGHTLIDIIGELSAKTELTAAEQAKWNSAVETLCKKYPEFIQYINKETGDINIGTEALHARVEEYKALAIEQARQKALQDKYDAVAKAYESSAKLQLEVETKTAILGEKTTEAKVLQAQANALEAERDKLQNETGMTYPKLNKQVTEAQVKARSAWIDVSEIEAELNAAKKDYEKLLPEIKKAEEELAAAKRIVESAFKEEEGALKQTAETLNAAEEALNKSAENINTATETLNAANNVTPELAENAEKTMQTDLNSMSLSVPVTPAISGSGTFGGAGGGGGGPVMRNNFINENMFIGARFPGHADGLDNVPYDNYIARLHKGEKVLTAKEATAYRSGEGSGMIVAALNTLAGLLQQIIANTGAGQQIVLDTGILAGALAGPMNQQLGTIATRQGRRN